MELSVDTYQSTQSAKLMRGMEWGVVGGLTGTLCMDVVLMGGLIVAGLPAHTCFSIVGDTVARFFSLLGIQLAGGVPLGIATHYVIGPLFGAIFGAVLIQMRALKIDTRKRCILAAVLYVEIMAQPILATTPLLMKMTTAEIWQWFGFSFIMHFLMAVVLGMVVSYGLRLPASAAHSKFDCQPELSSSLQ
jgi:hypothetical protein